MPSLLAFALRSNRGKKSSSPVNKKSHSAEASKTSGTGRTSDPTVPTPSNGQNSVEQQSNHKDMQDHLYNHHRTFHPNQSPVPPAIEASQSSSDETSVTAYNDNKHTSSGFQFQTTASSNEEFLCLTRPRGVIVTPDGLKARRPLADLQAELGLDFAADLFQTKSGHRDSHEQFVDHALADAKLAIVTIEQPTESTAIPQKTAPNSWHVTEAAVGNLFPQQRDHYYSHFQQQMYPPRGKTTLLPHPPSRSWSSDGTWSSPTPVSIPSSNPSFHGAPCFSWQTTTPSAESPNLVPGQARTAVGHLVAMAAQHQKRNEQLDPPAREFLLEPMGRVVHSPMMVNKNAQTHKGPVNCLVLAATPPAKTKEEPSGALATMDSISKALASKTKQVCSTPPGTSYDNDWQYSPQDECVESMFSPMFPNKSTKGNSETSATTSSSTKYGCPESTNGMVVLPDEHADNSFVVFSPSKNVHDGSAFDGDFRRLKSRNQKRAREDLMIAAFERLQDDPQLVSEVQNLGMMVAPGMDQNLAGCLFTGIEERQRDRITEKLELVLEELDSGLSVDEFLFKSTSPSLNCYRTDDEHIELREALHFCKVLVKMAIPEEEKDEGSLMGTADIGRWQFLPGLREAVGIRVALTPDARSPSCFSLPDVPDDCNAETPMTSNLSFCCNSTLTTALPLAVSESNDAKKNEHNGLDLREAIIAFASPMNRISQACRSLADPSNEGGIAWARAADLIKMSYHDLHAMKKQHIKFIVDAFEFVVDNADDSCELTDHEEGASDADSVGSSYDDQPVNYRIVHATTIGSGTIGDGNFAFSVVGGSEMSFQSNLSSLHPSIVEEDEDEESSDMDDAIESNDLRRHAGSSDERDDVVNKREGSPRETRAETENHFENGWTRLSF